MVPLENAASTEFTQFLLKTREIAAGKPDQVKVFVLGDSHMQCEDFGIGLRQYFVDSLHVPLAGRGFAFPYPLAKTSHRSEMLFGPSTQWRGVRFTKEGNTADWGVAGWTANYDHDSVRFHWRSTGAEFKKGDELLIFSPERCSQNFNIKLYDSTGYSQNLRYNIAKKAYVGRLDTDTKRLSFFLQRTQPDSGFVLQGMLFQPTAKGLVYGISGTNGARLDHYLQNPDFENHLKTMDPDLVVICLGTNEAFESSFTTEGLRFFLQSLLTKIKSAAPKTAVLLVGPPDHRFGKKSNPRVRLINEVYAQTAIELDFTFWNQQQAMGGAGSIYWWRHKKLATKDMVHFTPEGYRLQARLLGGSLKPYFIGLKY